MRRRKQCKTLCYVFWILSFGYILTWISTVFVVTRENTNVGTGYPVQASCSSRQRAKAVENMCESGGYTDTPIEWGRLNRYLLVDDVHKIAYCNLPKCGSKSFKRFLGKLNSDHFKAFWAVKMNTYFNVTGLRNGSSLSPIEKQTVIKEYFKFIVVRHPLDRLRSAWNHKLSLPGKSKLLETKEPLIDSFLRQRQPERITKYTFDEEGLEFDQFLDLVHGHYDEFLDPHWTRIYDHCQPCHIKYDHVFRLETLADDIPALYKHISRVDKNKNFHKIKHDNNIRSGDYSKKTRELNELFSHIPGNTTRGVLQTFREDFELFGYDWDSGTNQATCKMPGHDCC